MDTITHGIAGALIAKAGFGGHDLFSSKPMTKNRLVTWVVMIGSIFPDSDVFRDMFSANPLLLITWHRSITHSLLLLPIWSVLLAVLTGAVARWRKWEAPSFVPLTGLYAIGILSHIVLDLVTTFGTMIWSPLGWSRPAWDILFIIDFTFAGILLIPQFLAWIYEEPERTAKRAIILWAIFTPLPVVIARLGIAVGAPVSTPAVLITMVLFVVIFVLPARGWGQRVSYPWWNRAGLALATVYILAATLAHHAAFVRVKQFADDQKLDVQGIGALPLPPSFWNWDGLVRSSRGVYEIRMDLSDYLFHSNDAPSSDVITRTYYPDAPPNNYIDLARQVPEVQTVLWFARFPVIQFHMEGADAVVEISDKRFAQLRRDRPSSFTYRVRFSPGGKVLSQGWERQ